MKQLINKPCRALMAIIAASLAFVAVLGSCSGYDDTELKNSVAELGDRLTALESLRDGIQADIDGLQALVENLESGSTITKVDSTADGFTIYFANPADTVKVSNGAKGDKGDKGDKGEAGQPGIAGEDAPSVIVKYDETDQKYYWGLKNSDGTEDFIKVSGNKVPVASGNLTVELNDNDEWVIKVDGQQIGDPIPSVSSNVYIQGVTIDKEAGTVTLKINDEVSLTYDLTVELSLIFGTEEEPVSVLFFEYGVPQEVSYVLAAPEEATMTITKPEGWKVTNNTADSKLTIIPPTEEVKDYAELEGNISILLTNPADGSSAISSLGVVIGEEPEITVTVGGEPVDAETVQTFYAGAPVEYSYSLTPAGTEVTFNAPQGWTLTPAEGATSFTLEAPAEGMGATEGEVTATVGSGLSEVTVLLFSVKAVYGLENEPEISELGKPEAGWYLYSDGRWYEEYYPFKEVVGVIFWVAGEGEGHTDPELVKALSDSPYKFHGLAVSIENAPGGTCLWSTFGIADWLESASTISDNTVLVGSADDENNLAKAYGYTNTLVMKQCYEEYVPGAGVMMKVIEGLESYGTEVPEHTSGWYIPSGQEYVMLCGGAPVEKPIEGGFGTDNIAVVNASLSALGSEMASEVTNLWLSHGNATPRYAWYGQSGTIGITKSASKNVRPILAF
ncbi:MAG TPA: DUF4988 domain-containing protein [Candidatus Coprenecus stercoravium]|uniref:DUF4988 domain-containing protein n=1 Tax=Candidatus Coprenecus stercoravium TaxID=2840735 RepID=A0A9D2KAZ5_9BACT|nr:DUF4988 domain-containing protein [Candidatus Coprenecus stercoravium]